MLRMVLPLARFVSYTDWIRMRSRRKQVRRAFWIENAISLALAIIVVLAMRSSVVEYFRIPSGSMIPTLLIGDHIFVSKFAYGWSVPFSDWFSHDPKPLTHPRPPRAGDVIVFRNPDDESTLFIKRVVGLPGDTIEIRNKVLYINQQMAPRRSVSPEDSARVFASLDDPKYAPQHQDLFWETVGEREHMILIDKTNFLGEQFGPVRVPQDSVFVLGDNRDFSNDSRFLKHVYIPLSHVRGEAFIVWISFWLSFSQGHSTFRFDRIGKLIH